MVAGHLQEKNGIYYAVLSYKDPAGKRKQPWISTGVPVRKGNKKKAEQELQKLRREYVAPARAAGDGEISPDMPFADYMEAWLLIIKSSVAPTTYCSYSGNVKKKIAPISAPTASPSRACRRGISRVSTSMSSRASAQAPLSGSTPISTRRSNTP